MLPNSESQFSVREYRIMTATFFLGALPMMVIPYIHIGIVHMLIWVPDKPSVSKANCTCGCFDTIFRGSYEKPGNVGYKHVYFNATWQTYTIWVITVLFILLSYESVKYLVSLIRRKFIRLSMLVLYVINIYPHYYAWWGLFSYYNEDFYKYIRHDLYFTLTEGLVTFLVLSLSDARKAVVPWKLLSIISISSMHVLVAGLDQFIKQLIFGEGARFLKVRDIGLMIPDLCHILVPLWELMKYAGVNQSKLTNVCSRREVVSSITFVFIGTVIGRHLW